MKKLIQGKFVDPSLPGIAYQLATWERNQSGPAEADFGKYYAARLHADIMMRAPLTKRRGGVFNG
jgi:hypothetical protein